MGVSPPLLRFMRSWFEGRTFRVSHFGGVSSARVCHVGVPQGGVLSPLVWLLFLSNLGPATARRWPSDRPLMQGGATDGTRVRPFVYADDVSLLVTGPSAKAVSIAAHEAAQHVDGALGDDGLKLAPNKCRSLWLPPAPHRAPFRARAPPRYGKVVAPTPLDDSTFGGATLPWTRVPITAGDAQETHLRLLGLRLDERLTMHYQW